MFSSEGTRGRRGHLPRSSEEVLRSVNAFSRFRWGRGAMPRVGGSTRAAIILGLGAPSVSRSYWCISIVGRGSVFGSFAVLTPSRYVCLSFNVPVERPHFALLVPIWNVQLLYAVCVGCPALLIFVSHFRSCGAAPPFRGCR